MSGDKRAAVEKLARRISAQEKKLGRDMAFVHAERKAIKIAEMAERKGKKQ